MKKRNSLYLGLLGACLVAALSLTMASCTQETVADLVVYGKIFTSEKQDSLAEALEETKALNCNTLYYNLQANQIKFYSSHHNTFKAQKAAELMIEEASKSNEENAILMAYMSMAVVHADNAEFKRSNECYEQVLRYLEKIGDG